MPTIPAYTINGFTRPELHLDSSGNIVLDPVATQFAATYGIRALYIGVPASTPYPPVPASLTTPSDANGSANSVAEGAAAGTAVGITASATNTTGEPVIYSLTADSSNGGFAINPTTGVVTVANAAKIDFESNPGHTYSITVEANDGILTSSQSFTIGVSNVAPTMPVDANAAANSVAEGAAVGTAVGITASSTDVNGPGVTWTLSTDSSGGGFAIDANGVITVADSSKIDYETAAGHAYTVTARASDGALTSSHIFTISVSDVPVSTPGDSDAAVNSVAEGAAAGTAVGVTASAVDPNGPASTYTLTGDTSFGGFAINSTTGVVTVADASKIDFETAAGHAYTVTAQATNGAFTSSQAFTIAVTDVAPSTPTDANTAAANTVTEGAVNGTAVGITVSSTDINGPPPTYSLTDNAGGRFAIDSGTGIVTVANGAAIDFESATGHAYSITAQASDGTLTSSHTFTIGVSDVAPSAPTDSNNAANTIVEGAGVGTLVGVTAASTDVNGPAVIYSFADIGGGVLGDAGGRFQIDSATGEVRVSAFGASNIDYESAAAHAYSVTVQASDGTLTSALQTFSIAVTNVAPSTPADGDALNPNGVTEGAANGTYTGLTAASADTNSGTVTYSLTDSAGGRFTIDSGTGAVSIGNAGLIDFESSGGSYSITVAASDGTNSTSQNFAIAVANAAPSLPTDGDAGAADVVTEGVASGVYTGLTAASTDVNGPAVSWTLTDDAGGRFAINSASGAVTTGPNANLIDFETSGGTSAVNGSYSITAQASDGAGGTRSQTFAIAVADAPPANWADGDGGANTILEGAANGTQVGVIAHAVDPNGGTVIYSLAVNPNNAFAIGASSGIITVANSTQIDFESTAGHQYTLTVQGTDASGHSTTSDFVVDLTDAAPSTPTDTDTTPVGGITDGVIAEGAAQFSTVGITAHSLDVNGPAVAYSLSNDAGGLFTIDATTGVVSVTAAGATGIDYEGTVAAGHTYAITVEASDGTLSSSQNFVIGVTNAAPSQPTDSNGAAGGSIQANAADNTQVGITLASTDINGGAVTYSITDPSGAFAVDANTGVVTLKTGHPALTPATNYTITAVASDGPTTSAAQTFNIFVSNNALNVDLDGNNSGGVIGNSYAAAFTEQGSAVPVTDTDDVITNTGNPGVTTATSATIVLTNAQAGDSLLVNGALPGGIGQTTTTGSGQITITLSGTASYANYQAALHQIQFSTSGDAPNTTPRTINVTVTDSTGSSPVAVSTITVTSVNDAPALNGAAGAVSYTENAGPTALFAAGSVADPDAPANFAGGSYTVAITGNASTGDQIVLLGPSGFSAVGSSIVFGGNTIGTIHSGTNLGTSVVTIDLNSSATASMVSALAHAFGFQNSSDNPSTSDRTVSFTFNDGNNSHTDLASTAQNSNVVTQTVQVIAVNDAPVAQNGNASGNEDNAITGTAVATDIDSPGLTYSLVGGANGGAAHGTVTFTNAATGAYTYTPAANFNGTDTFTYKVNDGSLDSNNATITVTVSPANDAPVLDANGSSAPAYTENGAAAQLLSAGTVTDVDNPANFAGGGFTVAIQSPQSGDQIVVRAASGFTLADNGGGNFALLQNGHTIGTVSFGAGSATVTGLTAFATPAVVNQLVEAFGYQNTLHNFDTTARVVDFTFNDGGNTGGAAAPSNTVQQTITLTAVNDAPVNHVPGAAQTIAAGSANVAIAGLSVSDIDGNGGIETTQLTTVHGNLHVTAVGTATISGANDSHDLTISGTTADITLTLATLNYTPDAGFSGSDVLTVTTSDGGNTGGGPLTDIDTVAIAVTSAGGAGPTLDLDLDDNHASGGTTGFSTTFSEDGPGVSIVDTDVTVTAAGADSLTSATITLVNHKPNDVLVVNSGGLPVGITASAYDPATGVITLTSGVAVGNADGTNTAAEYQTALQQITFSSPGSDPDTTDRTITVIVNEGATASNTAISTVHVTATNDAPSLSLDFSAGGTGFATAYTANGAAIAIADGDVTITDPDNTTLASASVVLTNMKAGDILSVSGALPAGIAASTTIGANTITVTLTGPASLAEYQSALQQITFSNSSDTPATTQRDITVTVNDGLADSNVSHTTITVNAVNHAPVAQNGAANGAEDNPISGTAVANDVDNPSLTYSLVGAEGGAQHGTVIFTDTATGAFIYTPNQDFFGTDTFTFSASDGSLPSNNATITLTVAPVNDAPVLDLDSADGSANKNFTAAYTVSAAPAAITPTSISITDVDDTNITSATVTLTNAQTNDVLAISGALPGGISAVITPGAGPITVSLSGSATLAQYQTALHQIVFSNGSASPDPTTSDRIVTVVVDDGHGVNHAGNTATTTIHLTQDTPPVANAKTASATEAGGLNNSGGSNGSGNVITDAVADSDAENPVSALVVSAFAHGANPGTLGSSLAGDFGTLTLNANGSYSYAVNNANTTVQGLRLGTDTLTDSFNYTIRDTAGLTTSSTLTITIHGANDNPVAVNDAPTAIEAGTSAGVNPGGNVLTNDTDVDSGDSKIVQGVAAGTQVGPLSSNVGGVGVAGSFGTLTIAADGTYSYVVNNANTSIQALRTSAQTLTDTFSYTMHDAANATSTAQVTVTIQGQNDAPVASADTATATEAGGTNNGTAGTNISNFNVLTGVGAGSVADTDPDSAANGETQTVQGVETGTHLSDVVTSGVGSPLAGSFGTLTLNSNGSYSYTVDNSNMTVNALNSGAHVNDIFTYTMHDAAGVTSTTTLNIQVNGANDAPVGVADSAVVFQGRATTPSVNLLANDTDIDTAAANLTAVKDTNPAHGSVTVNSNGSFTYTGNAGYLGADSFTYHVADNGSPNLSSATITVTLDVQPLVWHIDNTAPAAGEDGSAAHPWHSIAAFNAANAAAGAAGASSLPDIIYLHNGTGTYTEADGFNLKDGQTLLGQGVDLTYQTSASAPGGAHTVTLLDANNSQIPTIVATAGDGIDLAQNNTVQGLHIGNASGVGISDGGGTVGTLNISSVDINSTGQAIDIDQGGTLNVSLSSVTSSGGAQGIQLAGSLTGTFAVTSGTLSGHTGSEFDVNGGAGTISYGGTIGDGSGLSASIANRTGGSVTLSGGINDSNDAGGGVSLSSNTGATISFSGGMTLNTGTSNAFSATGGGTVNVTGTGNHLTTTTGTALNITNTTIGASGLTFHDISANGGTNGIVLNTTGATAGLTVTGNANAAQGGDSSGGVIQNTTGDAISLTSTLNPSFTNMNIHNNAGSGIHGTTVTGFTFDNGTLSTNGNSNAGGVEEANIRFDNLLSSGSITDSSVSGGYTENVLVNQTSGTLNRLTITGNAFGTINATGGNDNILFQVFNNGTTANLTVSNNTFAGTRADFIAAADNNNSTMDVVVRSNTFHNGQTIIPGGGTAVHIASGSGGNVSAATTTYDISHNIDTDGGANAFDTVGIFVSKGQDGGTLSGTIASNSLVGKTGSNSDGIFVRAAGSGTNTVLIQNNTVTNWGNVGIHLQNNDGSVTTNASVFGNSATAPGTASPFAAFFADNGATATDTNTMNLVVGSSQAGQSAKQNTLAGGAGAVVDVSLSNFNASTHFNLSRNGSAQSTATGIIQDDNVGSPRVDTTGGAGAIAPVNTVPALPAVVAPMLAAPGGVQATSPTPGETHLTQAQLDSVVAAAIAQWAAAGASASQLAALHATTFSVADLSGNTAGEESSPAHITIDTDAAGHGWFVDPTPSDNSEFTHAANAAGTDLFTDPSNAAAGHLDLLTAVTHEMGHVLGLDDTTAASTAHDLMFIDLVDGERRLPDATDVPVTNTTPLTPNVALGPVVTSDMELSHALAPVVTGTPGNDTIDAGHGGNILVGGAGADNFVFANVQVSVATPPPLTHVTDYSFAQGDSFDFSALTSAFHGYGFSDTQIVRAVEDASGTFATLQVNANGPWSKLPSWVNVAQLDGAHAGDAVNILIDNHSVHLAQIHVDLLV